MRLKIPELRRFVNAISTERNVALIPARSWGYSIGDATIIYPLDAIQAWYREPGEVIYDVGPEPKDPDVAMRRVESIIFRLMDALGEPIPRGMERAMARLGLKVGLPAIQVASLFWHLEHGRIEAKQRTESPNYVRLGGFPAYGLDFRAYKTPTFEERCYGVLAHPAAPHDDELASILEPLQNAPTRAELWACFQEQLPAIAPLVPPLSPGEAPVMRTNQVMPIPLGATPLGDDAAPYEADGIGEKGFCEGVHAQQAFYADPEQIDVSYYLTLLQPTIRKFLTALSAIAGKARSIRKVHHNRPSGAIEPSRLTRFAATKDLNVFRQVEYIEKHGRLSVAFLIDDSGSMGSLSASRFPEAVNVAYPRISDIQSARFIALALAEAAQQIGGVTWISTINHLQIDEWGRTDHKKALGRIVATGGSAPDEALSTILAKITELPAPRIIVFITDGEVSATPQLINTSTTRLISIVPPGFTQELYGSPTIPLDDRFFDRFTNVLRTSAVQLAARN